MKRYNPTEIEPKWQAIWAKSNRYQALDGDTRQKFYISCMFPYPSGDKLHVGHWYNFAPADTSARFMRMKVGVIPLLAPLLLNGCGIVGVLHPGHPTANKGCFPVLP
jgi:hypothetical protein